MIQPTFRPFRILILTGLWTVSPLLVRAQFGIAPVSPALSPRLTDQTTAPPVTSLTTDLLVPQRTTTYDPTGASVLSTALNPLTNSSARSASSSQTDTAVRDSSQVGRTSSLGRGSARLQMLGGDSTDPESMEMTGSQGLLGTGRSTGTSYGSGEAPVGSDFDRISGDEGNSAYGSSWGASSSSARQSGGSGWGAGSSNSGKMGMNDAGSLASNVATMFTSGGSALSARTASPQRSNVQSASNGLPGSASRLSRTPGVMRKSGGSSSSGLGGKDNSSTEILEATLPGLGRSGTHGSGRSGTIGGDKGKDAPQTLERVLLFSPLSYVAYSFGRSPFASPEYGDLTFLRPNIFNTTPIQLSSGSSKPTTKRQDPLKSTLSDTPGLDTGATNYGLASRRALTGSGRGHEKSSRKNPFQDDSSLNTDKPYASSLNR